MDDNTDIISFILSAVINWHHLDYTVLETFFLHSVLQITSVHIYLDNVDLSVFLVQNIINHLCSITFFLIPYECELNMALLFAKQKHKYPVTFTHYSIHQKNVINYNEYFCGLMKASKKNVLIWKSRQKWTW